LQTLVETVPMVMVLNRFDEFPAFITDIAYIDQGRLQLQVSRDDATAYDELYKLLHLKTTDLTVPAADPDTSIPVLNSDEPLVRLTDLTIKYDDKKIIDGLNWTIEPNQHWQLSGPNGSGKTGLLSIINGDHPQCYVNDIFVFGFKRGSGESIWQIKQFIGYVSTGLQWEYKGTTGLRNVILSGFHDSIGLYSRSTDKQKAIANEWLELLGMSDKGDEIFGKLSYGDQRLLLIARAMVKHPPLLILDEPCLGLDDMNRQMVLALIEKICAGSEISVIYVNHHPEDKIKGIENYIALD
jgi:molybdate transport system ATP-binding protein